MLGREVPILSTALVLVLSSGAAMAEDAAPEAAAPEPEERPGPITGTRIRGTDPATPAPVLVIGREEIVAAGRSSLGELLQTLPEQGNAVNPGVNEGGDGSIRVNLRGIGTSRTLVLVNGRRWMPGGSGADGSVDLSSIPSAVVERIEVLKSGGASVYGSDAIAGVVNVVTRRGGDSTDASVYTGTSRHGDGTTFDLNLTRGARFTRGGVLLSVGYLDQQEVMSADRSFSRFPYFFDATTGRYTVGSGTIPAGRTLVAGATGTGNTLWNDLVAAGGDSFIWDPGPPGAGYNGSTVFCGPSAGRTECFRRYMGDGLRAAGQVGDGYDFVAENALITPQRRFQAFATGDLALGSSARAFLEASYANRRTRQQSAPEPLVLDGEGVVVSGANAYNPFGLDVYARRRLVELGPRTTRQDVDAFRVVGGLDGKLPEGFGPLQAWSWNLDASYGRTEARFTRTGSVFLPALAAALGPSFLKGQDANGRNVYGCGTPAAESVGCVPLDLFGGPGSITPEQAAGLRFDGRGHGYDELQSLQANASGALFRIVPDRPAAVALGYEHRRLSGARVNDPVSAQGLATGNRALDTRGAYRVDELFGELSVPIASGAPGAQDLEAIAAARWFEYSTFGSDSTYEVGARWRPIRDVTVRGALSTAFRAPTLQESYRGRADDFPSVKDPCRGPAGGGPPLTPEQTALCGAAAYNGDTSTRIHAIVGGNPDVGPETARVRTVGLVLEPRWVPNLSIAVDYYSLDIDGTIGRIGADALVSGCYTGAHPEYCARIVRDPATQFIDVVQDLDGNAGKLATAGVDVAVRYALRIPAAGRFGLTLDATWLRRIDQTLPDGTVIHGRNTFDLNRLNSPYGGAGGTFPAWKANARLTWALRGLGAGVSTRFLGSFHECGDSSGDFSGAGLCYVDATYARKVSAYHTEDVFISYAFGSPAGKTTVTAGVLNVFDAAPAAIYNAFVAATDAYNYDEMGRFFYVRLAQTY